MDITVATYFIQLVFTHYDNTLSSSIIWFLCYSLYGTAFCTGIFFLKNTTRDWCPCIAKVFAFGIHIPYVSRMLELLHLCGRLWGNPWFWLWTRQLYTFWDYTSGWKISLFLYNSLCYNSTSTQKKKGKKESRKETLALHR